MWIICCLSAIILIGLAIAINIAAWMLHPVIGAVVTGLSMMALGAIKSA